MKKKLMNVGWVVVVFLLVVVVHTPSVKGAVSCGAVVSALSPCIPYLRNGGAIPPKCCAAFRSFHAAATTVPDRQAVCRCLKSAATSISGINPARFQGLPQACGVPIPYRVSAGTDCSKVK